MSEIYVTARIDIHDGQLDAFKTAAEACLESVRTKDTGTLQYDWYFNDDHTVCHVHERYVDSDAVMTHMGNLGDTLGALLAVSDFSALVYGTPSAELAAAVEGFDITVCHAFQSL